MWLRWHRGSDHIHNISLWSDRSTSLLPWILTVLLKSGSIWPAPFFFLGFTKKLRRLHLKVDCPAKFICEFILCTVCLLLVLHFIQFCKSLGHQGTVAKFYITIILSIHNNMNEIFYCIIVHYCIFALKKKKKKNR